MRLPSKVTICGVEYKIVMNHNRDGAHVDNKNLLLEIGTFNGQALNNFLHEIIEVILRDNLLRYRNCYINSGDVDYMFVFDHKDFSNIIPQIATAIKGILK